MRKLRIIGALCALTAMGQPWAQTADAIDHAKAAIEFEKFRAEMEESNPSELFELKGEELWKAKRGSKNISLAESCDLGLGIGKIEGAYVQMPRYFADVGQVMDAQGKIIEGAILEVKDAAGRPAADVLHVGDGAFDLLLVGRRQRHPPEILALGLAGGAALAAPEDAPARKADVLMGLEKTINEIAADGKQAVVIVDEAHSIEQSAVFEELRLLLNFETDTRPLVTLLLSGQPELKSKVESNKQLNQRVSLSCHLTAFGPQETKEYILHRLNKAGAPDSVIDDESIGLIHQRSGGIPRWINTICHMSLLTAFTKHLGSVDNAVVEEAVQSIGAGV